MIFLSSDFKDGKLNYSKEKKTSDLLPYHPYNNLGLFFHTDEFKDSTLSILLEIFIMDFEEEPDIIHKNPYGEKVEKKNTVWNVLMIIALIVALPFALKCSCKILKIL
jgi:hypothetical protein